MDRHDADEDGAGFAGQAGQDVLGVCSCTVRLTGNNKHMEQS